MKCSGCSEINEAGMQFCIFCGHSLQSPAGQQPASAPLLPPQIDESLVRSQQNAPAMVLICTACGKTDPLNGQFCVYCGARTYTGSISGVQSPLATMPQPLPVQSEFRNTGEEHLALRPGQERGNSGVLFLLIAVVLGLATGFTGVFFMRGELEKNFLATYWPSEGVLILSAMPNADIEILDHRKKSLVFGKLSDKGSLHLANLPPGEFHLNLSDSQGKTAKQDLIVNVGERNIIGYPKRLMPD